jgi:hypothetical protein
MSLILSLALTGCSIVEVNLPASTATAPSQPSDTGDSGDAADTATEDSDNDPVDSGGDSAVEPDSGGPAPAWTSGVDNTVVEAELYGMANGVWLTDMDHDGLDDLIVTQSSITSDGTAYQLTIAVYPSNGDGSFGAPTVTNSAANGYYSAPILADITDDGIPDIVAASGTTISLFAGASGRFRAEVNWSPVDGSYPLTLGSADLDGDGAPEVVVAGQNSDGTGRIDILGRDSAGALGFIWSYQAYTSLYAYTMVAADLDGNGRQSAIFRDLYGSSYDYAVELYDNWGTEYLYLSAYTNLRFSNDGVAFGFNTDYNGDGSDELVSVGTDGLQFYDPNVGHAELLRINDFENYPTGVVGYDLDGDGTKDALESLYHYESTDHSYYSSARLSWVLREADGFTSAEHADFDIAPWSSSYGVNLAAGDANADGCGDVAFFDAYSNVHFVLGACGG